MVFEFTRFFYGSEYEIVHINANIMFYAGWLLE
jgi:hypothetical protein